MRIFVENFTKPQELDAADVIILFRHIKQNKTNLRKCKWLNQELSVKWSLVIYWEPLLNNHYVPGPKDIAEDDA